MKSMTLAPGTKLGPYELLASIGAGGMGEVWKARDTRLGRIVAIKKVKEQHSERFKQEARSIAALNHPNICQIHDVGDDYLVLEYVEGNPLSGPLHEKEAVRLAIQIATALETAHKKGIIHRDLKPGNIMVTKEGSVKLLDFGLAKLYEQSASESTAEFPATQAGAVLGTVAYMSPEQAQGQPADARSDIFSFGLVLYEMLSGKRAFAGDSTPAVMAALLRDEPPPLQASPLLEKIVRRCMAKQPLGRCQTISEVRTELEKVAEEKKTSLSAEPQPSIAVLPFVNMSGDKEQEYFSDGLAEEIINALTQIPGLKVIARTSAFAFKDKREDIRRIAEVLGVTNILEGSVRKAGNRLRITAQLIAAADGSHIWSERYDREMNDVFAVQDNISQAIVEKLRVRLSGDRPLVKLKTENINAYNLYLKGRYHLTRATPESVLKGKEYFEQAITADPSFALAWFGLALFYWGLGYIGAMPQKAANMQSSQAARKAIELDEMLAEPHGILGVLRAGKCDWKGAESEFHRALELGPDVWDVWFQYATYYLAPLQRYDEAIAALQKALQLDPLSSLLHSSLGGVYMVARKYDHAIEQLRNALDLDSRYMLAHMFLGMTHLMTGKVDEGINAMETAMQVGGNSPYLQGFLAISYAQTDRIGETDKILKQLQDRAQRAYVPAVPFAVIYFSRREFDMGFDWLEKAVEDQDFRIQLAIRNPIFDSLRSHPRYHALLRKMNLES